MTTWGLFGVVVAAALAAGAVLVAPRSGTATRLRRGVRAPGSRRDDRTVRDVARTSRLPRARAGEGGGGPAGPLLLDLVVVCLDAGLPPATAVEVAAAAVARSGLGEVDVSRLVHAANSGTAAVHRGGDDVVTALGRAFALAGLTGAPAVQLVSAAAVRIRAERHAAARVTAARLGSHLVLPLGLTVLPAFVLLGVVPVVLALAAQVASG